MTGVASRPHPHAWCAMKRATFDPRINAEVSDENNSFVVVYNKPGRLVPSRLRTPQAMMCLVSGLVVLVL